MESQHYFKKTTDDFYPNFASSFVLVKLRKLTPNTDEHRVGVWGNDDFGMVKDFDTLEEAQQMYAHLDSYKSLDKDLLHSLEFEYF